MSIDLDNPPPEQVAVECGACKKHVSAVVIGKVSEWDGDDPSVTFEIMLATCPACRCAIVAGRSIEQWGDWQHGEYNQSPLRRLWPLPIRELSTDAAPEGIRRDFDEAQRCMSVSAHTAAAMLTRRVLEGVAVDLGASPQSPLAARLKQLRASGAIDGRLAEWADALRVVGNDAAHNVETVVSRDDAADAISFAEALADYVYTFRARYDRFLERRNAPPEPPEPPFDPSPAPAS